MKKRLVVLAVIIVIIVALAVTFYIHKDAILQKVLSWGSEDGTVTEVVLDAPTKTERDRKTQEEMSIETAPDDLIFLALGIDTREGLDQLGVRTDTMMLFRVSFEHETIRILSIPRDSRVLVKGRLDKINHAHSYGGIDLTMKTVEDFLNIPIDYYTRLDYQAVSEVVDSIGGVELDVKDRMYYHDPSARGGFTIDFQPGRQHLSGEESILFLRYRSYPEGDVARVKNQQYFIRELITQAKENVSLSSIPGLVNAAIKYTDTNLSIAKIIRGLELVKNFDQVTIETQTIPGYGQMIGEVSYYIVNESKTKDVINDWFGDLEKLH